MRRIGKKISIVLSKHWIWKMIFIFLPTGWLFFIDYCPFPSLKNDSRLTAIGWTTTIVILLFSLFTEIFSTIYPSSQEIERERDSYKSNVKIYEHLLQNIGDVCNLKYQCILGKIRDLEKGIPITNVANPEEQLKCISREIRDCFCEITGVYKDNLVVSMAYCCPTLDNEWEWIDHSFSRSGLEIKDLISDMHSSFYQLYSGKQGFLFENDKNEAQEKGIYIFDKTDKSHNCIGSIVCNETIVIAKEKPVARLILSVSTYGQRFTDSCDKNVVGNIKKTLRDIVLSQFEKRINIELSLLFIREYQRYTKDKTFIISKEFGATEVTILKHKTEENDSSNTEPLLL